MTKARGHTQMALLILLLLGLWTYFFRVLPLSLFLSFLIWLCSCSCLVNSLFHAPEFLYHLVSSFVFSLTNTLSFPLVFVHSTLLLVFVYPTFWFILSLILPLVATPAFSLPPCDVTEERTKEKRWLQLRKCCGVCDRAVGDWSDMWRVSSSSPTGWAGTTPL